MTNHIIRRQLITSSLVICQIVFAALLTACSDNEHDIEDYPLNYEITEVKASQDIPVGAFLVNAYGDLTNAALWDRLTNPYDASTGEIGPYVKPVLGQYRLVSTNSDDHEDIAHNLGQIAAWAKKAKIDFLITHPIRENAGSSWEKDSYPNNINVEDSIFLNLISGRTDTLGWKNDGSTKYAIQIHTQNISAAMGSNNYTTPLETRADRVFTDSLGGRHTTTQTERLVLFVRSLAKYFKDDTYYKTPDGRPVVIMRQPEELYSTRVDSLYDALRAAMKEVCGMNPYIICTQKSWSPTARLEQVVLAGKPDAITMLNMSNVGAGLYERLYWLDVFINENYKLNHEYLTNHYPAIDFIPSVSNGYSYYVRDGRYNYPDVLPSTDGFRKRCWIAKQNLGRYPMVIIDAWNDYGFGSFIEPTDPNYGNGYGEAYLDIVAKEFKR